MKDSFDYSTYLSPFTIRYGSEKMRNIWSEENKRKIWRSVWVSLAKAEHKAGLVSKEELEDIIAHQDNIDITASREREKKVYHELMSEIQIFSEQCTIGGGKIHLGATSTDVLDNTTVIQITKSLQLIQEKLTTLLSLFANKIEKYSATVCMGYTHLQPAEPTTLGYRFAFYTQDLLFDLHFLEKILPFIKGKGLKGAVGTSASFTFLLEDSNSTSQQLEKDFLKQLGIHAVAITNQTYPRKIDLLVIELLANIASSLHKFCFDYRIMQSPLYGEWMEKRNQERVGSSAMPFKRNPDRAEKICSLCRYVSGFLQVAWSNPAYSLLERTLDDSAAQRLFLPEAFLAIDDCLNNVKILLENFEISSVSIERNLVTYGQLAGIEPLLMECVKKGADRQSMHEVLKQASMEAWNAREQGQQTDLLEILSVKKEVLQYVSAARLQSIMNPSSHIGQAKGNASNFLKKLKKII